MHAVLHRLWAILEKGDSDRSFHPDQRTNCIEYAQGFSIWMADEVVRLHCAM